MSKYQKLWEYVQSRGVEALTLTFDDIQKILGIPIDHSFLTFKKELLEYGYEVGKMFLTDKTVIFKNHRP